MWILIHSISAECSCVLCWWRKVTMWIYYRHSANIAIVFNTHLSLALKFDLDVRKGQKRCGCESKVLRWRWIWRLQTESCFKHCFFSLMFWSQRFLSFDCGAGKQHCYCRGCNIGVNWQRRKKSFLRARFHLYDSGYTHAVITACRFLCMCVRVMVTSNQDYLFALECIACHYDPQLASPVWLFCNYWKKKRRGKEYLYERKEVYHFSEFFSVLFIN